MFFLKSMVSDSPTDMKRTKTMSVVFSGLRSPGWSWLGGLSVFVLLILWVLWVAAFGLNRVALPTTNAQTPSVKPQLILQTGHAAKTDAIVFSLDGRLLATGSADRTVKLWDTANGNELRTLPVGIGAKALAFSPDGQTLVVGGTDGALQWWDVTLGEKKESAKADATVVTALAFSPDGRWLVMGGLADAALKVWDATTRQRVREITGLSEWITALAFSPDGARLAAGNAVGAAKSWSFADGHEQFAFNAHRGRVRTMSFSATGETLATCGQDGAVRWWNTNDGKLRQQYAARVSPIVSLRFVAPSNQWLVCADDHQLSRHNANGGAALAIQTEANILNRYESAAFNADGEQLAACDGTRNVTLRATTGNRATVALDSRVNPVKAVTISGDGRWLAFGHQDATVTLWETTAGQPAATLANNAGSVNALAFSPDHQMLAVGSYGGVVQLWNVGELRETRRWNAHNAGINALAFTPDGKQLITASVDRSLKSWDAESGTVLGSFAAHKRDVSALALTAEGQRLYSAGADGAVIAWDMATRQPLAQYQVENPAELFALALSHNGQWLSTGGANNVVSLIETATGRVAKTLRLTETSSPFERVLSLQFSNDDQTLAVGHSDGTLALWDANAGTVLTRLNGHTGALNGLAYAREGGWLLSGSEDGSVRLWQAPAASNSANSAATAPNAVTEAATLLAARGEWLVVTPAGFFDGSPLAWRQVLWRLTRETAAVAPVEIFFNEYFYPELLATVFGKRPLPSRENISQRDRRQPQVELSVLSVAAEPVATRTVTARLKIREAAADATHPQGSGASDVRLFRNGSLVKIWRGDALRGQSEATLETQVTLMAGENRLTAYAFNRANVKSGDAAQLVTGAESLRRRGTAYLLAAGLNQYSNPGFNLSFAVADAELFCAEWQKQQGLLQNFERVETVLLTNEQATKTNLLAALQQLGGAKVTNPALPALPAALAKLHNAQPEDAVIVYFAGHGVAAEPRFYLLPHELGYRGARDALTPAGLKEILRNGISDQELEQAFETIDASYLLLALDACNSGQALEAEDRRRGPMNTRGLAQLAYEKGLNILAASQSYQIANENKTLGHGYLTYALIEEGVKKLAADRRPRDGQVWLREWLDYATQAVPQLQERYVNQRIPTGQTGREIRTRRLTALREVQRPRIFYRREIEAPPLVIARQVP